MCMGVSACVCVYVYDTVSFVYTWVKACVSECLCVCGVCMSACALGSGGCLLGLESVCVLS